MPHLIMDTNEEDFIEITGTSCQLCITDKACIAHQRDILTVKVIWIGSTISCQANRGAVLSKTEDASDPCTKKQTMQSYDYQCTSKTVEVNHKLERESLLTSSKVVNNVCSDLQRPSMINVVGQSSRRNANITCRLHLIVPQASGGRRSVKPIVIGM